MPRPPDLWPFRITVHESRDLISAANYRVAGLVYEDERSLIDLMITLSGSLSGFSIDRYQIILISDQNSVFIRENKICQPFIRALITPQSFSIRCIDRGDSEWTFLLQFSVL